MSKTKRPKTIIPKQSPYRITTKEGDNLPTARDLNMMMEEAARWPSAPRRSICDELDCAIMGGKTKRRKTRRKRKTKRRKKSRRKRKTKRRRRRR